MNFKFVICCKARVFKLCRVWNDSGNKYFMYLYTVQNVQSDYCRAEDCRLGDIFRSIAATVSSDQKQVAWQLKEHYMH
jgi:hypothetical protein